MNLGIKDKVALVTGAGRGLGAAIATSLAREGVRVVVVSRTRKDLGTLTRTLGKGHIGIASDLTRSGEPERVIKIMKRRSGVPNIVVNNLGGILDIKDPFCPISDWQKIWRLNMEVAIEINNLVIPVMQKKKWGRIVHISSISALENQGTVPYCTVKAALTAYSRSMGRIVSADGVIMTSVLPGAVFTQDGYWDYTSKTNPAHVEKYLKERMAIKRFGTPDEIANIVTFLCSEHASFCVGSHIVVDGGQGRTFG